VSSGYGQTSSNSSSSNSSSSSSSSTKATPSKLITGYLAGSASARKGSDDSTPAASAAGSRRGASGTRGAGARTPATEKLRQFFHQSITINEDAIRQVTQAMNKNKAALKFDMKEKCKRQETAIKDLQNMLVTLMNQVKAVEIQCIGYETDSGDNLRAAHLQLQELAQSNAALQSNENRLKKECSVALEKAAAAEGSLTSSKKETQPLRKAIKDLEGRISKLVVDSANDQAVAKSLQEDKSRLLKEASELKQECNLAKETTMLELKRANAEFEQRLQSERAEIKEEHSAFSAQQMEILRREAMEAEQRALEERGEHRAAMLKQEQRSDEVVAALKKDLSNEREQCSNLAHKLSKMESGNERVVSELTRAADDIAKLTAQLANKDEDLRKTQEDLRAAHGLQKALADERTSLHGEVAAMQVKVTTLEEHGFALSSDLAISREQVCSSSGELVATKETLAALQATMAAKDTEYKAALTGKEAELYALKDAARQLEAERENRERAERRESSERQERIAASAQLLATQTDCNARIANLEKKMRLDIEKVQALHTQTQLELDVMTATSREQADTIMSYENEALELRSQLEHACANHETVEKLGRVTGELEILKRRMRENADASHVEVVKAMEKIQELQEEVRQSEVVRRKLHNTIQELRGNVRVFARVRPFLPSDGINPSALPEPTIIPRTDGSSLRIVREASAEMRGDDQAFSFDKVFGPSSSQETVFTEVSEFVQSALDGYHVCLFSYGQTGSGKTHTMQGSGSGSMRGIISRAMEQVGRYKTELETKGWEYHMEVSFIEIYNESIRDLLRANAVDDVKHDIKRDVNGNTTVTDVTMKAVDPNDLDQMSAIMDLAAIHRSVGQTAMNERSSRSHSVFCLHLKASNAAQKIILTGALNLVDLAGSERLDRSLATGARQTETVAINKSLSALTDVFVAIGNKNSHIPFRNSKLTYLLQPALSGDGKTLMMVNLSPTLESFGESVCSLRFASQVNQCELGKPKKQTQNDTTTTTPQAAKLSGNGKIGSVAATCSVSSTASARALTAGGARKLPHR